MLTKKPSRLGVGAAAATFENLSEDWTKSVKKQILSVGKKRRHEDYVDDNDGDDAIGFGNDKNSSSDEEEGRTTAVKERKKKKVRPDFVPPVSTDIALVVEDIPTTTKSPTNDTKTKKKKKGKKERAQEQQVEDAKKEEVAVPTSTTTASEKVLNTANNNSQINSSSNKKRKRKKVRSRQKNIAKDNREVNKKPSHLVLGRADYAGRPLTQTTRDKLGIKNIIKTSTVKSKQTAKLDDAFESGEWVREENLKVDDDKMKKLQQTAALGPDRTNGFSPGLTARNSVDVDAGVTKKQKKSTSEEGILTKIGDCIVRSDANNVGNDKHPKKETKKHKKKYKNS